MSGTSLDGVDAALLETDGEDIARPGPGLPCPMTTRPAPCCGPRWKTARDRGEGAPVPHAIRDAERR